jgi:pathogenesis-related protein 1
MGGRSGLARALAFAGLLTAACGGGGGDDGGGGPGPGDPDANGGNPGEGEPAALAGITAMHNEARAAVGVGPMSWSAELAATAQAWADACVDNSAPAGLIDHNDGRSNGHPYYVGENIFGASGGATAAGAVSTWVSESANYDYASNSCDGICGHYTQVVWAASVDLGCGISSCPGLQFGNSIVCDYGPGGNDGGRPY